MGTDWLCLQEPSFHCCSPQVDFHAAQPQVRLSWWTQPDLRLEVGPAKLAVVCRVDLHRLSWAAYLPPLSVKWEWMTYQCLKGDCQFRPCGYWGCLQGTQQLRIRRAFSSKGAWESFHFMGIAKLDFFFGEKYSFMWTRTLFFFTRTVLHHLCVEITTNHSTKLWRWSLVYFSSLKQLVLQKYKWCSDFN